MSRTPTHYSPYPGPPLTRQDRSQQMLAQRSPPAAVGVCHGRRQQRGQGQPAEHESGRVARGGDCGQRGPPEGAEPIERQRERTQRLWCVGRACPQILLRCCDVTDACPGRGKGTKTRAISRSCCANRLVPILVRFAESVKFAVTRGRSPHAARRNPFSPRERVSEPSCPTPHASRIAPRECTATSAHRGGSPLLVMIGR